MAGNYRNRSSQLAFYVVLVCSLCGLLPATVLAENATQPSTEMIEASCLKNSKWNLPGDQQALSTAQFLPKMLDKNVVILGEFHDSIAHHQWQLHTLSALYGVRNQLVIGLEMLPPSAQPALDRWVAGVSNLDQFLKESKWYDYWKFDIELYLPILQFARINNVPVYGLNVERALVKEVSAKGWDNIPEAERQGITDPAAPKQAYLEMLAASFAMHGPGAKSHGHGAVEVNISEMTNDPKFKRFVQGQQLWDRGMAHTISSILQTSPETQVVAIMGSGHVMNGLGVPHQLKDLGVKEVSVLIPWDGTEGCEMITEDVADAVFGVAELPKLENKNKPKLGVVIENTEKGVRVTKVLEDSLGLASGIKEGDLIVEMAGVVQDNVMGVIENVQQTAPGRWLPMVILRGEERLEIIAKFPVKPLDDKTNSPPAQPN